MKNNVNRSNAMHDRLANKHFGALSKIPSGTNKFRKALINYSYHTSILNSQIYLNKIISKPERSNVYKVICEQYSKK